MAIFNSPNNAAKKDAPSFASVVPAGRVATVGGVQARSQEGATPDSSEVPPAVQPREAPAVADFSPNQVAPPRPTAAPAPEPVAKESLIAADLTIEGKIEGSGHVRIAGKFKGDVNVQGNLRIEDGAKLNGGVKARQVVVAGELDGNIQSAERVELLNSAVLTGDVKAGSLTVAAGSKIRGHVECGWDGAESSSSRKGNKGENAERETLAS
ncbi:MAG TPA: polymer-forming cytoskeletal protein [Luteimonas sp.]|nr:polymer-forming cytoskeletal protein [Luteimonas sp.]